VTDTTQQTPRVALVTGSARGIGAATAERLARDGYAVGVLDLEVASCAATVSAITAAGGSALALGADVGDSGQVTAAVTELADQLGGPTVVVNNAGITRDNLLFKLTEDDWDAVLRTHLRGAFLVSKATQGFMTEAKWGRIVNLSSTSALGNRGQANYAAAKAGMQGFTKTLSIELGPFGVTVNAIAPGFIATDMTAATAERLNLSPEEFHRLAAEQIPLRRVGVPADIANVVSFLVSEDASYVSGQVIYVAGGPKD
jgi:3-oxoacyl-[acyl-carrier protein] reductase